VIERESASMNESPVGESAADSRRRRATNNPEYRRLYEGLETARSIAWQVLEYRMDNQLTQQQLADRAATSYSQISRIESGMHKPSIPTLERLAKVMGRELSIKFVEYDTGVADRNQSRAEDVRSLVTADDARAVATIERDESPAWGKDFWAALESGSTNQRRGRSPRRLATNQSIA
jgi:transcriptional regulator with XRE-family HTH domain